MAGHGPAITLSGALPTPLLPYQGPSSEQVSTSISTQLTIL